jgi:hypothetical protein
MLNSKTLKAILFILSFILLAACGSSKKRGPQPYRPLDLRGQSESFISGANDGCETAYEKYKKDHEAFNNDFEYNEGWWAGRHNCEGREIPNDDEE